MDKNSKIKTNSTKTNSKASIMEINKANGKTENNHGTIINKEKKSTKGNDKRWLKLMLLGERMGCHQIPERSFFYKDYQFPVCARCFGVLIGYIVGFISYLLYSFKKLWIVALIGCSVMFLDWLIQYLKIKKSTNTRRLITGIMGGFGLMIFYLGLIVSLLKVIIK